MCNIFQEKPAPGAKQMAARNLSRALVSAQDEPCVVHPEQKILHMPAEALSSAEKAQDLPPRQPSRPSDVRLGEHPSVCHLPAGAAGDGSTEKSISVGMWGQGFRGPRTHTVAQVCWAAWCQEEGVPRGCHCIFHLAGTTGEPSIPAKESKGGK